MSKKLFQPNSLKLLGKVSSEFFDFKICIDSYYYVFNFYQINRDGEI